MQCSLTVLYKLVSRIILMHIVANTYDLVSAYVSKSASAVIFFVDGLSLLVWQSTFIGHRMSKCGYVLLRFIRGGFEHFASLC